MKINSPTVETLKTEIYGVEGVAPKSKTTHTMYSIAVCVCFSLVKSVFGTHFHFVSVNYYYYKPLYFV